MPVLLHFRQNAAKHYALVHISFIPSYIRFTSVAAVLYRLSTQLYFINQFLKIKIQLSWEELTKAYSARYQAQ